MNLFVFTTRSGRTRQVSISPRILLAGSLAVLALAFVAGLTAGRALQPDSDAEIFAEMRATRAAQQAELEAVRDQSGRNVDALAARLGQLSAHIIRLDALGQRLVNMAGLEDGEFNFGAEPPMGGPDAIDSAVSLQSGEITKLLDDLQGQIEDRSRQLDELEALM